MPTVKVLQILRGSGSFGGVANFLTSRYKLMNKEKVEFFFLFCQEDCLSNSQYAELIGKDHIFELGALKQRNGLKEYRNLYRTLLEFLRNNSFDYVHINTGSLPVTYMCLKAAQKAGVKSTIAHSHSSNYMNGSLNTNVALYPIKTFLQYGIYKTSKYHFACSKLAAENMFGNRDYTFVCNSIEADKFNYDPIKRDAIRNLYNINDCVVYGFVGRLSESKNIGLILDIFEELLAKNQNSILWIVGDGEEKEVLAETIKDRKLSEYVVLFGIRNDVNELMQAMDIFLFPSLYEGLSLTVIEAQAAGLPVFMSDTLSDEHKVTELAHFLPLKRGPRFWADYIIDYNRPRKGESDCIKKKGYDIFDSYKWLEDFYRENR